jgi:hypothetical protein
MADHMRHVHARWFACLPDAEAAIAEYEGQGTAGAGHAPGTITRYAIASWLIPATRVVCGKDVQPRRTRHRWRRAIASPEEDNGWTVLATTVSPEIGTDAEILQAYQEQHATVEPGFRWIKNPAAISPVWLEKPERIAVLAMLTVVGMLVYSIIQRQVPLYLLNHTHQVSGNEGTTATPTAAVVLALFAQVALVQFWIGDHEVAQVYGLQPHHLLICDALGLDHSWCEAPLVHKTDQFSQTL